MLPVALIRSSTRIGQPNGTFALLYTELRFLSRNAAPKFSLVLAILVKTKEYIAVYSVEYTMGYGSRAAHSKRLRFPNPRHSFIVNKSLTSESQLTLFSSLYCCFNQTAIPDLSSGSTEYWFIRILPQNNGKSLQYTKTSSSVASRHQGMVIWSEFFVAKQLPGFRMKTKCTALSV